MTFNTQYLSFLNFVNSFYEGGTRWALLNSKSEIIACRVSLASDISSMGLCLERLGPYVKLNDGDIYLTNQLQTTQSHPLDFLLIQCVQLQGQNFFLVEMTGSASFTSASEKIYPLPPFPLYLNSEDQSDVLTQMGQTYGDEFVSSIRESINRQLLGRLRLFEYCEYFSEHFQPAFISATLKSTYETAVKLLEEIRLGEHSSHLTFRGLGELHLTLKKEDDHLFADFSRSKVDSHFQLFSSDFRDLISHAFSILSGFEIPINEGLLGLFNIRPPKELNSSGNRSTAQLLAIPCFSELFFHTLRKLYLHDLGALNAPGAMTLQMKFADKTFKHIFLGGGGAKIQSHGEMGRCPWLKDYSLTSLENIENQNPIEFVSVGPSPQTGGRGLKNGGEGISWSLKTKESAEVFLESIQFAHRAEGCDKGQPGEPAQIPQVEVSGISYSNHYDKGSIIHFVSGGGGGFGETAAERD